MPLELPPQPVPSAAAAAPAQCCGTAAVAVLVLAVPTAAGGGAEQGGGKLIEGPLSGPLFFSEGNATAPGRRQSQAGRGDYPPWLVRWH